MSHTSGLRARILLASLILIAASASVGFGQTPDGTGQITLKRIDVGLGGAWTVGCWTPVAVEVESSQSLSARVVIRAADPDGNVVAFQSPEQTVSAGTGWLTGLFQMGRLEGRVDVEVSADGRTLATRMLRTSEQPDAPLRLPLEQSAAVLATLGNPAGFESGQAATSRAPSATAAPSLHTVALADSGQLPAEAAGLEALDILVVAGDYDFEEPQARAVQQWVRRGGHLLISVGADVDAYRESALAGWVQDVIPVSGQARVRQLTGLETFTARSTRIPIGQPVATARIGTDADDKDASARPQFQTLVPGPSGPLVARAAEGFGTVTLLTLDLDRPPLSEWQSTPDLIAKLIEAGRTGSSEDRAPRQGALAGTGVSDLASQLHAVQEQFPQVERFSSWGVLGMILVYVLLIGPVDYLLVHRVLKRPQLTWLTFPAIIVAAALLASWTARAGNATGLRLNQLDIVDIDAGTGFVRSRSWASLYSPETQRYSVAVTPLDTEWGTQPVAADASSAEVASAARLSWYGVPERGFGGMYRAGGLELARPAYRVETGNSAIHNLPIPIWSTKALSAQWGHENPSLAESTLRSSGIGHLEGTVVHRLPVPLDDWLLAYGRRVYRPVVAPGGGGAESLPPLAEWSPNGPGVLQRDLANYLTGTVGRRVAGSIKGTGDEIIFEQTRYDPTSRNPLDILRTLTFHEAAGGTTYTGLENAALQELDLSPSLELNRAVLFGRIDARAAGLNLDGRDTVEPTQHWAFVRIVLPVEVIASGPRQIFEKKD